MSSLPRGWARAKLTDLVGYNGLFSDGDWIVSKDQDPNGPIRLLQLADIGDGVFLNNSRKFINETKFEELRCTEINEGDVLELGYPAPKVELSLLPLLLQSRAVGVPNFLYQALQEFKVQQGKLFKIDIDNPAVQF